MKTNVIPGQRLPQGGIALLTVLALLTLTAVLILAFFSISQTELRSTSCYAGGAEAQLLSKTAIDLVQHQLRAATEDSGTAWASQPGAIRVWGKHQGQESVAAYKLYSDDQMTIRESMTSPTDVPASFARSLWQDTTEIRTWHHDDNKDVFVDLNEPILRAHVDQAGRERVKVYYPIVDPRAYHKGAQKITVTRDDWKEPSASQEDKKREVEGFFFETSTVERGPYPKKNGSKIDHYVGLPMPVKWLYQLKDGTLGTLERSANRPQFKAVSGDGVPSRNNPMVGRIAFWTDDESCKLNVNTAAGGSPWDTPRAGGKTDRDFGLRQPVQKEFQRYPAHPATTSLAPVLFPHRTRAGEVAKEGRAGSMNAAMAHEKIYEMVPRVQPGGSTGGERQGVGEDGKGFWTTHQPPVIEVDHDRLYATIDEFIFHATRKSSQGLREPQEAAGSWGSLDGEFLDRVKFFLTTSSRAPEVTVFNTPRISVWPSYYEPNYQTYLSSNRYTEFDKRIRFCAEVGQKMTNKTVTDFGHIYHFQRRDASSPTVDFDQIPRNKELFGYLLWLMKQDVPGIGKSFDDKYTTTGEVEQIATEIFDYVRCTNLFDDMVFVDNKVPSQTPWTNNQKDHLAYTNNRVAGNSMDLHSGHGQVAPIQIGSGSGKRQGFGRFYGINEVGIAFIATAEIPDPRVFPLMYKRPHQKDFLENEEWGDGYNWDADGLKFGSVSYTSNQVAGTMPGTAVDVYNVTHPNPTHIIGGKRIRHYADLTNKWDRTQGSAQTNWAFDYTNVPPFDTSIVNDSLYWDGHTLEPGSPQRPKDAAIALAQDYVANLYHPGWNHMVFEQDPENPVDTGYIRKERSYKARYSMVERWNYIINKKNWNYTLRRNEPLQNLGDRRVQAILLVSMFCPSKGWTGIAPDFRMKVELFPSNPFQVKIGGTRTELFSRAMGSSPTPVPAGLSWPDYRNPFEYKSLATFFRQDSGWHRPQGGLLEPQALFSGQGTGPGNLREQVQRFTPDFLYWAEDIMKDSGLSYDRDQTYDRSTRKSNSKKPHDASDASISDYPWVSDPFTVPAWTSSQPAKNNTVPKNHPQRFLAYYEPDQNASQRPVPMTILTDANDGYPAFEFDGGQVRIQLYTGGGFNSSATTDHLVQTVEIDMAKLTQVTAADRSKTLPRPNIARSTSGSVSSQTNTTVGNSSTESREFWCFSRQGCFFNREGRRSDGTDAQSPGRIGINGVGSHSRAVILGGISQFAKDTHADNAQWEMVPYDVVRSYVIPHGDYRLALARTDDLKSGDGDDKWPRVDFVPHEGYYDGDGKGNDMVYSACAFSASGGSGRYGRDELHTEYRKNSNSRYNKNLLVKTPDLPEPRDVSPGLEAQVPKNMQPDVSQPPRREYESLWGDWDNTSAAELDGAFINKPDEGNSRGVEQANYVNAYWRAYGYAPRQFIPYYTEPFQQEAPGASFFSPNRMMPGPGMLGSLPTGVVSNKPWQTLLFRPLPNNGRSGNNIHPGYLDPKDHYLLDFFWMPVVEPWSISEPFSTAGKVNLNYAMQPFAHIKRASGVIGVMFSEQMLTIPADQSLQYKGNSGRGLNYNWLADTGGDLEKPSLRSFINHNETLRQFDDLFNSPGLSDAPGKGDLFHTASELCEMWLVPDPVNPPFTPSNNALKQKFTLENTPAMWDPNNQTGFTLVGDNSRERPYAVLLPRLTTKSNTFQVHYRAQIVKQAPISPTRPGERRRDDEFETFDSDVDAVTAEFRGSTILERYIDPNEALTDPDVNKRLPDYAALAASGSLTIGQFNALDRFYRFRVVSEKRFAP